MNEDGIAVDGREACSNRIRTLGAALNQATDVQPREDRGCLVLLTRSNHDADGSNGRVTDQRLHGPAQHRLAAEQAKLLRDSTAHTGAASGGDDERGCCHGGRL
jgi:hypothetical protein